MTGPSDAQIMQELMWDVQDHIAKATGTDILEECEPRKITLEELLEITRQH